MKEREEGIKKKTKERGRKREMKQGGSKEEGNEQQKCCAYADWQVKGHEVTAGAYFIE